MITFNTITTLKIQMLVLSVIFFGTYALAEKPDVYQALSISAMDAEVDEPNGWARYTGDVELQQGSLLIQCDQLQIFKSDEGVDKIIAEGKPARYSQNIDDQQESSTGKGETIKAHADRLTYQLESRSIELQGNAKIQQGENIFEGHSILYQIDNRKIIARSSSSSKSEPDKKRVKIVLPVRQPKS